MFSINKIIISINVRNMTKNTCRMFIYTCLLILCVQDVRFIEISLSTAFGCRAPRGPWVTTTDSHCTI